MTVIKARLIEVGHLMVEVDADEVDRAVQNDALGDMFDDAAAKIEHTTVVVIDGRAYPLFTVRGDLPLLLDKGRLASVIAGTAPDPSCRTCWTTTSDGKQQPCAAHIADAVLAAAAQPVAELAIQATA